MVLILLAMLLIKRIAVARVLLIAAFVILWLGGNSRVAMGLARSLEWRYLPPEQIPEAKVIVLLGGGTQPAVAPRQMVEVNGAGDRVLYAAWLFNQGKADHILLSGGVLDWSTGASTPAEDMASILQLLDIPAEALWIENQSRNTYENAVYSARMLNEKGIDHILLVTSASHMPRAVKLFEGQGLLVTPLPADFTVTLEGWQGMSGASLRAQILNLLPSVDNLALTTKVLKEYFGMLVYELRGWQ